MRFALFVLLAAGWVTSCRVPDEPIVLKGIQDVRIGDLNAEETRLTATALLHNPNNLRVRLLHLEAAVWVDGKPSARVDQELDEQVPPNGDFSVPLEVMVSMKDLGLLDKIFTMLQGKKIMVEYRGSIRVKYRLVPITVPFSHKSEIKLKL